MDAYCRILMLAKQLGKVNYLNEKEERELLALKDKWGFADPRNTEDYKNCDICANDIFRDSWASAGVERGAFDAPPAMGPKAAAAVTQAVSQAAASAPAGIDEEKLIKLITDQVLARLGK